MTLIETIDAARKILKHKLNPARTFPDDSSSFLEDSEMIDWYNWAQMETQNKLVQTFENWFVTSTAISIVAGTEEYSMPSGCLKILRVEDIKNPDNPIEIPPMSFNDKDRNYWNTIIGRSSSVSELGNYAIKGNRIVFRPKPTFSNTQGVKVYYERRVDTIISATDSSIIPQEYHELIMWGVVENGLIKMEATAEAMSMVLARRNRLVQDLIITGENRQIQRSRTVRRKKGTSCLRIS